MTTLHLGDVLYRAACTLASTAAPPRAPLERTEGSPRIWRSAQALAARIPSASLAEHLTHQRLNASALPDGLLEVRLTDSQLLDCLGRVAADLPVPTRALEPIDGTDGQRWPTSTGAFATHPSRRTLDNPVFACQFALVRARDEMSGRRAHTHPTDGLLTELLDAPRRMRPDQRPDEIAAACVAVATAYLAGENRFGAKATGPRSAPAVVHVLEIGLSLLGVSAPGRI